MWDNTGCMHRVGAYPADRGRMASNHAGRRGSDHLRRGAAARGVRAAYFFGNSISALAVASVVPS
jgi:hypothetical protein